MRIRALFRCPDAVSGSLLYLRHVVRDFDIEVIFLYPWAVVFKDINKVSIIGLVEMMIFIALFLVAYVYAWRKGALEWD